jgi:hypothetical protein
MSTLESTPTHLPLHGNPYARVDLNPIPESALTLCQSRLFIPQSGTLDLASGDFLTTQRSADFLVKDCFASYMKLPTNCILNPILHTAWLI